MREFASASAAREKSIGNRLLARFPDNSSTAIFYIQVKIHPSLPPSVTVLNFLLYWKSDMLFHRCNIIILDIFKPCTIL